MLNSGEEVVNDIFKIFYNSDDCTFYSRHF